MKLLNFVSRLYFISKEEIDLDEQNEFAIRYTIRFKRIFGLLSYISWWQITEFYEKPKRLTKSIFKQNPFVLMMYLVMVIFLIIELIDYARATRRDLSSLIITSTGLISNVLLMSMFPRSILKRYYNAEPKE
jgi:hypothetical protein